MNAKRHAGVEQARGPSRAVGPDGTGIPSRGWGFSDSFD